MCLKKFDNDKNGQYKFYINNFIEDVEVTGTDKWTDEDMLFRAPLPNKKPVDGKLVELTLSPFSIDYSRDIAHRCTNTLWSNRIMVAADAVTYVKPVALPCYESDRHEGCYILLMGNRLEDIPFEQLHLETYPHIVVWESYDFVIDKLQQAGWHK